MRNNKIILAGSIGTLVEWAEFCFYGYLVHLFSHLFFPMLSEQAGIIAAFGAFAISYIARPIGSIIFGYMGDKLGRKKAFSSSILLMGFATLCMGLLPTYNSIGYAAPLLLMALRFLQGMAVAGEYTGAAVVIIENNTPKPYLASSWISTSSAAGMLVGSLFGVVTSLPMMPDWAWRVPFCCGFVGCLIGFYLRAKLAETPQYQQLQQTHKIAATPIKTLLKHYRAPLLKIATIAAFIGMYIYICNIWWVTYVIEKGYFTPLQARVLAAIAQGSVVVFTPLMGMLAEAWNGKKLLCLGIIGNTLVVPLLFFATSQQASTPVMVGIELLYALSNAALTAPMFKYFADIFPAPIRYSGQTIGWNVAVAIFGGTAPLIAQFLATDYLVVLVSYVMLGGIIALLVNYKITSTQPSYAKNEYRSI